MRKDRPSATAQRVALRRAAHQLLDRPLVLDDPIALRIIGAETRAALEADPSRHEDSRIAPFLRAFIAVRSRFAEDSLAEAIPHGVRQYVVLGAGLDTFAYRNPHPNHSIRVFEVDHPATQAWKRSRLVEGAIAVPPELTFVPVDFETAQLPRALAAAGFRHDLPTWFAWLGVTMYLTRGAFDETLRFITSQPAGSGVVFDYALSPAILDAKGRALFERMAERVGAAGEPWRTTFVPDELARDLRTIGFTTVEDLGAKEIQARYLAHRDDGLRVGSIARLLRARV
jgi:methyltransferase (TIGR00027 family)